MCASAVVLKTSFHTRLECQCRLANLSLRQSSLPAHCAWHACFFSIAANPGTIVIAQMPGQRRHNAACPISLQLPVKQLVTLPKWRMSCLGKKVCRHTRASYMQSTYMEMPCFSQRPDVATAFQPSTVFLIWKATWRHYSSLFLWAVEPAQQIALSA